MEIKIIRMKKLILLIATLCCIHLLDAQISSVDGFNYYDINKSAYTVSTDCYTGEGISAEEVDR